MGITKPCTQFHPAPSTSTQLSATPSTLLEPKYCTWFGNFPKFMPNWHTWYIGGADSESRLFGPKKSKLSVMLEDRHKWYLGDADYYFNISPLNFLPKIHFWANLGQKSQSSPFYMKIGRHVISRMLILISTLVFWISNQKSIFWQIWVKKSKLPILPENWHMLPRGCGFLFWY